MFTLPRISTGALLGAAFICLATTTSGCAQDEYQDYGYYDEQYVGEPGYVVYHEPYPSGYFFGSGYSYYDGSHWHGGGGHHGYWHHDRDTIPNRVPRDADVVTQGQGPQTYTADKDGTVYVRDAKNNKVLYRGRLKEGETFTLDPSKHRATVDGDVVRREITRRGHENQVYFDPRGDGRRGGDRAGGGSGRVESRRSEAPAPRAERSKPSASRSDGGGGGRSEGGHSRGGGGDDGGGGSGDRKR